MHVLFLTVPAEIDLDLRADHFVAGRSGAVRTVQARNALPVLNEVHIVDGVLPLDIEVYLAPSGPDHVARGASVDAEIDFDLVARDAADVAFAHVLQVASRSKAGA